MEEKKTKVTKKTASKPKAATKTTKKVAEVKAESKTTKTTPKKEPAKKKIEAVKTGEPKNVKILGYNDLELNVNLYDDVTSAKAVIIVIHGMQEHCLRYDDFAKFFNKNGYIVVTSDNRGHGKTMRNKEDYGRGEKDIYAETIKDQLNIINFANEKYNLPIYLFGHSYGSLLSQVLIQSTPLIDKCVLCGTTNGGSAMMKMGSFVISLLSPFKKSDKRGGLVEKLTVSSYSKKFENGNWLSRDNEVFEKYKQDELCGGSFPFSFYRSMIKNMRKANKGMDKIGNKKIFLIAGDKDPVGENGKQVKKLYRLYLNNNVNAKLKLYKDARHELINETNKDEVYHDVLNFFND